MGNLLGNKTPNTIDAKSEIKDLFTQIISKGINCLETSYSNYPEVQNSINYVKDEEIQQKALFMIYDVYDSLSQNIDHVELNIRVGVELELPFLEMKVSYCLNDNTNKNWIMNFWPCSACKCVSMLQEETNI